MKSHDIFVMCSGVYLVAVASVTMLGYLLDAPGLTNWNAGVGMATNTATCFIITGVCLIVIGRNCRREE